MKCVILLVVFITIFHISENANILVVLPVPGKSHFNIAERLMKALVMRGHKLDVVSHFPLKEPLPGYNDLSIKGTVPSMADNLTIGGAVRTDALAKLFGVLDHVGAGVCEPIFKSKTAQTLKNSTRKYDLLITHHLGTKCMLGFGHLFKIPTILLISSVNLPWTSSLIGLPDNPSYIPNYFTSYVPEMTIFQRLINTIVNIVSTISYSVYEKEGYRAARHFFGSAVPNLDDLGKNISLVFVNSHFSLQQSRPVTPNFVEIAGIHIDENIMLSTYFEEILESETEGIILTSFGSMIRSDSFREDKLKAIFETFKELPYKILWKGKRERFPKQIEIPNNVQFEHWMPQLSILCHPNVKLFISHGGMFGILEALHCGVPILGIPIFADQPMNIANIVRMGIAIEVPFEEVSVGRLMSSIKQLISDPKYKTNAEKASHRFKDRPLSALDTAIYWVEYVIRHKGASHLRSVGADLPWYQYYLVDVVGIFIFSCVIIVYIFYKFARFAYINIVTIQRINKKYKRE